MRRTLITTLLGSAAALTAWGLAIPSGAHADCIGPTFQYEGGSVRRGATITVTGNFWGDECYDTGPPPVGEGPLGLPLTDIEIVFIQGEDEIVVARGNADESYGFTVDVSVPPTLDPGEVTLDVQAAGVVGHDRSPEPTLRINDKAPKDGPTEVADFGPSEQAIPADATPAGETEAPPPNNPATTVEPPANTEPATTEPATSTAPPTTDASATDGDSNSALPWLVGAGALAALGAGGAVAYRRRQPTT